MEAKQGPPERDTLPGAPAPLSRFLNIEELRRFKDLHVAARFLVEGLYSGRHRSSYHDASAEFVDYRPYAPGDDLRSIDWRAYARTDRDYIKLFRKETELRCHVLLDSSLSMDYRGEPASTSAQFSWPLWLRRRSPSRAPMLARGARPSKFEYGAYLAAALCYLMIQQGDRAGMALGASGIDAYVPPGGTLLHLKGMLNRLDQARPTGPTCLSEVLKALFPLAARRGLLVVISDLLEDIEPLFRSLGLFTHHGWQVVLFHVLTKDELNLPGEGLNRYRDAEGMEEIDVNVEGVQQTYQSEVRKWLGAVESFAKARRIHYTRLTTDLHYTLALERYLHARGRS